MEKIALVTDSTSDLNNDIIEKYNIHVLRLKVIYKDREYIDGVTITSEEVFSNLAHEIPTTSTPVVGDANALFTQLEEQGYTHVISVHISSGLSGTLNMIDLAMKSHPKLTACVFDSKALSLGCGALVIGCAEMIAKGKSYDEITKQLPAMREKISVFFVVDTLKYLIKGGRIGKVAGALGSIMDVKPIISIGKDGIYYTYEKIRGKKQVFKRMLSIAKEKIEDGKAQVWVMHGNAAQEAKQLMEKLKTIPNISDLKLGSVGPVLGVHTGPGLLAFAVIQQPFYK
jgi:DegV family protein with EDD domain